MNDISKLQKILYNPLLNEFGKYDLFFFPLRHDDEYHFTLLILDKPNMMWLHYDPKLPSGISHNPCYEYAEKMVIILYPCWYVEKYYWF